MQMTRRLGLFGMAVTAFGLCLSSLAGDMKPYKGWIIFPPTTGADGTSSSVRHDNIGGVGLRQAVDVPPFLPPVIDPVNGTVTVTMFEEGVITYPDGSTITDAATVVLVFRLPAAGSPPTVLVGGSAESVITGGTGRFKGAHGWGNVIVEGLLPFDLATGEPFRMPFEGMISTVGSLKQKD